MGFRTTMVRVTSGGQLVGFFIAEDITESGKYYTMQRSACEWFDKIYSGNILSVVATTEGTINTVLSMIPCSPVEDIFED